MSTLIEMINALESVCDYDDIDCVESVSYRQGALQALVEVEKAGVKVPESIVSNWVVASQQAVDIYIDNLSDDDDEENTNA